MTDLKSSQPLAGQVRRFIANKGLHRFTSRRSKYCGFRKCCRDDVGGSVTGNFGGGGPGKLSSIRRRLSTTEAVLRHEQRARGRAWRVAFPTTPNSCKDYPSKPRPRSQNTARTPCDHVRGMPTLYQMQSVAVITPTYPHLYEPQIQHIISG
jgi:hypothetical protein